jgi:DNA primase
MTVVDDIKSRLDILEVVSGYVPLQRSGRSYKTNCPFHQEKTPSFHVFPDRQTWRCFGACATGGDLFSYVMKAENMEFGEALKRLAQQAGVALPTSEGRSQQKAFFEINEAARSYFQQRLASSEGADARSYLEERGLDKTTIDKFEMGLSAPDGESLKDHLVKQGFSLEQLAQGGIVTVGESGRYRDLFRRRLMIPIRNSSGELGGFGGRALDDSNPKYLNSPRTPVFDKGRILYGLCLAKDAIRQKGVVVVEGYMDAAMAHQHGFDNVVASMGTALTEQQVGEIRRLTNNIVMAMDADAAGQQATLRSLESSWRVFQTQVAGQTRGTTLYQRQDNLELKVAVLSEGKDPDEIIRKSPEQWPRLIENARPLFEYLLAALSGQADVTTPQGKAWVAQRLYNFIAAASEPIQQDQYFQILADHLKVNQDTLRASMGRFTAQSARPRSNQARRGQSSSGQESAFSDSAFAKLENDPVEEHCLAYVLQNPELHWVIAELKHEYFRRPENREIFNYAQHAAADGFDELAMDWLKQTVDEGLGQHLEHLLAKVLPPSGNQHDAVRDIVHRMEKRYLQEMKAEEAMRFAEMPSDGLEDQFEATLDINQRLKKNELGRIYSAQNASAQNASDRR